MSAFARRSHLTTIEKVKTTATKSKISFSSGRGGSHQTKIFSSVNNNSNNDDDDDDNDGWGTTNSINTSTTTTTVESDKQMNELRSLQQERSSSSRQSLSTQQRQQLLFSDNDKVIKNEREDRDLFIPIVAILSLVGLFGAYGYETLRLASRGELYLPKL